MHQVFVVGVGWLDEEFGVMLTDASEFPEAEVKRNVIDIPCGNGCIDLTGANGGPFFSDREQRLVFALTGNAMATRRIMANAFSGRLLDYQLARDPGYTYRGRWSLGQVEEHGRALHLVTATVRAEPYKLKERKEVTVHAGGGTVATLESGRMSVRPSITCARPTDVSWDGGNARLEPGTWTLDDLWLEEGGNAVFFDTAPGEGDVTWADVADDTWAEHATERWCDMAWDEKPTGDAYDVVVAYDWKDL